MSAWPRGRSTWRTPRQGEGDRPRPNGLCWIFGICLFCVVFYAMAISSTFAPFYQETDSHAGRCDYLLLIGCRHPDLPVLRSTRRSSLNASFQSGEPHLVRWGRLARHHLVNAHIKEINVFADNLLGIVPWMLAVVPSLCRHVALFSGGDHQGADAGGSCPGVSPVAAIAAFARSAPSSCCLTYPDLIAAVEFDVIPVRHGWGNTFDHPFLIPGTCTTPCGGPGFSVRRTVPVTAERHDGASRRLRYDILT